jgi:hypothetical protein
VEFYGARITIRRASASRRFTWAASATTPLKGDVRFLALDSTYLDAEQVAWLELNHRAASPGRSASLPLSSGAACGSERELQDRLEPLFVAHGVVVFAGHDHLYERVAPQPGVHHFSRAPPEAAAAATARAGSPRAASTANLVHAGGDHRRRAPQAVRAAACGWTRACWRVRRAGERRDDPVLGASSGALRKRVTWSDHAA